MRVLTSAATVLLASASLAVATTKLVRCTGANGATVASEAACAALDSECFWARDPSASKRTAYACQRKEVIDGDRTRLEKRRLITAISGDTRNGPVFDRPFLDFTGTYGVNTSYSAYPFTVAQTGVCNIAPRGNDTFFTDGRVQVYLYTPAFDPTNSTKNGLYLQQDDDDESQSPTLKAGQQYVAVFTGNGTGPWTATFIGCDPTFAPGTPVVKTPDLVIRGFINGTAPTITRPELSLAGYTNYTVGYAVTKFSVAANSTCQIDLVSNFDNVLYIYQNKFNISNTADPVNGYIADDDSGEGLNARVTKEFAAGTTYWILGVSYSTGRTGDYSLVFSKCTLIVESSTGKVEPPACYRACVKPVRSEYKAATKACKAKPRAERRGCLKAAKNVLKTATKFCKTAVSRKC